MDQIHHTSNYRIILENKTEIKRNKQLKGLHIPGSYPVLFSLLVPLCPRYPLSPVLFTSHP